MVLTVGTDPDRARARRRHQGQTIRKLRDLNELSIADLAEALDVTPGAISQWENGRYTPRQHLQLALARALNVPHSTIFGLDQEMSA